MGAGASAEVVYALGTVYVGSHYVVRDPMLTHRIADFNCMSWEAEWRVPMGSRLGEILFEGMGLIPILIQAKTEGAHERKHKRNHQLLQPL
jgi:hypothetical protein